MHTVETAQGKGIVHDSLEEVLVSLRAVRRIEGEEHYLTTAQAFEERPFNLMDLVDTSKDHNVLPHIYTGNDRAIIIGALKEQTRRRSASVDKAVATQMVKELKPAPGSKRYMAAGRRVGRMAFGFALSH